MRLSKVHVTEFQSILDSREFEVGQITCLVGKNEAGKTALLQALYKLNPIVPAEGFFSVTDDYPRRDVEDYKFDVKTGKRAPAIVVKATLELDDADAAAVAAVLGQAALRTRTVTLSKAYTNTPIFECQVDVKAVLNHLAAQHQCAPDVLSQLATCDNVEAASEILTQAEQTPAVVAITAVVQELRKPNGVCSYVYESALKPRIPKFLYFDEYYQMEGRANIQALKDRQTKNELLRSDHPLLGLIHRARLSLDDLLNPSRTRELKNLLEIKESVRGVRKPPDKTDCGLLVAE